MNLFSLLMLLDPTASPAPVSVTTTQDLVTFWIAVIGGVIGAVGFILSLVIHTRTRFNLKFSMLSANVLRGQEHFCFDFLISNCSSLPISIQRISIDGNDKKPIYFSSVTQPVCKTADVNELSYQIQSSATPITLGPYESFQGIFTIKRKDEKSKHFPDFCDSSDRSSMFWTINIETTRKVKKYKVCSPKANDFYIPYHELIQSRL